MVRKERTVKSIVALEGTVLPSSCAYMFESFLYVESIDLSLVTIYVLEKWYLSEVSRSDYMFENCTSIVGGTGTAYRSDITDKTYAVIDDRAHGKYGYLTKK